MEEGTATSSSCKERGRLWTDEELETFIDIWSSEEILSKMDGTTRNGAVFRSIIAKMAEKGFERSAKEIKNKMKNLKRDYKRVNDHNNRSGVERKDMPFKEKLDLILGDRPSARPSHAIQSGQIEMDVDSLESDDEYGDSSFEINEVDSSQDDSEEPSLSPNSGNGKGSSQGASKEPTTSAKRPSSGKGKDCRKRPRTSTKMKETMSVVSECFGNQFKELTKTFKEEGRRACEEQEAWEKDWKEQMAAQDRKLNQTMDSINSLLQSVVNQQQRPPPPHIGHQFSPWHAPHGQNIAAPSSSFARNMGHAPIPDRPSFSSTGHQVRPPHLNPIDERNTYFQL